MDITLDFEKYRNKLTSEAIQTLAGVSFIPEELQVDTSQAIIKSFIELAYLKGKYDQAKEKEG